MYKKIKIKDDFTYEEMKLAIDLSLQIGMVSSLREFPVVSFDGGIQVPNNFSLIKDFIGQGNNRIKYVEEINDIRFIKGIEKIFSKGVFLKDTNNKGYIDHFNFKIRIGKDADKYLIGAACNFAYRLGLEIFDYNDSIIAQEDYEGNLISFEKDSSIGMEILGDTNRAIYRIYGQGEEVFKFSNKVCSDFPYEKNGKTISEIINEMRRGLGMKDLDGQITYLLTCKQMFEEDMKAYFEPEVFERKEVLEKIFPNVEFFNYREEIKVYGEKYGINTVNNHLNKDIYLQMADRIKEFVLEKENKDKKRADKEYLKIRAELQLNRQDLDMEKDSFLIMKNLEKRIYDRILPELDESTNLSKLIFFEIKETDEDSRIEISVFKQLKNAPSIVVGDKIIQNNDDLEEIDMYMKRLSYVDGNYILDLKTNVNESFVKSYMTLLSNHILDMEKNFSYIDLVKLQTGEKVFTVKLNS